MKQILLFITGVTSEAVIALTSATSLFEVRWSLTRCNGVRNKNHKKARHCNGKQLPSCENESKVDQVGKMKLDTTY